jgi:MFS family permease
MNRGLYSWFVVFVLVVLYTSSFIDRMILNLMVQPIRADLGISDTQFSYLTGFAFVIMYSIAGVPVGWIVDRRSRRNLIALGVSAWSAMTALCGFASSYAQLFVARVGVGIGEATLSPASYSLVGDYFRADQLARALSVFALGVPIGSGLALTIGGPLIQSLTAAGPLHLPLVGLIKPWHAVFMAIGLPGFLLSVLVLIAVREPARHGTPLAERGARVPSTAEAARYIWTHRAVYAPMFWGQGLVALFAYGAASWYPSYLQRVQGFTIARAGLLLGLATALLGILGSVCAGTLSDRLVARGRPDGHLVVGMIYAVGLLACGVAGPTIPVRSLSIVMISATAFFAFTWLGSCVALLQLVTPNRMRGQVSALYLFFINLLAMGLGSTSVALVTDHVFGNDKKVGWSLALVAMVSNLGALIVMQRGRARVRTHLRRAADNPSDAGLLHEPVALREAY